MSDKTSSGEHPLECELDASNVKVGDKISVKRYMFGHEVGCECFIVESFRFSLGFFESDDHRKAGRFTPLLELYERSATSKDEYIANFGGYTSNLVPSWKIEQASAVVASELNAELGIDDKGKESANNDAEIYGHGFLVDGLRVHPSRVVIIFKNKEE